MEILEILKYILPSIVVLICSYVIIKQFSDREDARLHAQLTSSTAKITTPIRLAAYERIILFLERISPESIIRRTLQPQMTAKELHTALILTVRAEYEHNLSQQIYISSGAWNMVKEAKESMIQLYNTAAQRFANDAKASDLAKTIIEMYASVEDSPITVAIENVKQEIKENFS